MLLDGEVHETAGDLLTHAARRTSPRWLAIIAWGAGAIALAVWLAGLASWTVWAACYAAWAFAAWAMFFGRGDGAAGRTTVMRALEIVLVTTGLFAIALLGVLAFYALLGPRWVL